MQFMYAFSDLSLSRFDIVIRICIYQSSTANGSNRVELGHTQRRWSSYVGSLVPFISSLESLSLSLSLSQVSLVFPVSASYYPLPFGSCTICPFDSFPMSAVPNFAKYAYRLRGRQSVFPDK